MPQIEQQVDQTEEQQPWETPELVKSDVATATQANIGGGSDGVIGS